MSKPINNLQKQILFRAPPFIFNIQQAPTPDSFYLKDTFVCAFDLQFPGVDIFCGTCKEPYVSAGWLDKDGRLVQDLDGVLYFIQKKYKCNCGLCGGLTVVFNNINNVPSFIRCAYPVRIYNKSAITIDFLNHIINDATTGKTFHEIADGINTRRAEKYLRSHALYTSFANYYRTVRDNTLRTGILSATSSNSNDCQIFSAMDDVNGYNGDYNINPETITKDFMGKLN
jgi:hypothetical protein